MKQLFLSVLLGLTVLGMQAKDTVITSPDGRLAVTVSDSNGQVCYTVSYDGQQMLTPSALGLKADIGDFSKGLTLKDAKESSIDRTYTMTRTKNSTSHYVARQVDLTFVNGKGLPLTITFCVSDNDIAYRYTLQAKEDGSRLTAIIYNETSGFNFPEGTTTFLTPQSRPMAGWQRTKPSYEEDYKADTPLGEWSAFGEGFTFPIFFSI